jgi:ribonuclease P protein subunit RPR2
MVKRKVVAIARERIDILLKMALDTASVNIKDAEAYVKLAWRIAEKFNIRGKTVLRRYFRCAGCKDFLIPGRTCKIRILKSKGLGLICTKCNKLKIIPIFRQKK